MCWSIDDGGVRLSEESDLRPSRQRTKTPENDILMNTELSGFFI